MRILDGGTGWVDVLALSRDGRYLAAQRRGAGLELWDLTRDEVTRLHRWVGGYLWFGADGRLYENGVYAGQFVHDPTAGTAARLFGKRGYRPFTLTADGTELVVFHSGRSPKLQRYSLRGGDLDLVWEAPVPQVSPNGIAVSADGGTVAFSYMPRGDYGSVAVAVHDGHTGELRHALTKIKGEPLQVWVNRDGSRVAVFGVKQIVVWDPAAGAPAHKFNPEGNKSVVGWADEPTGTKLATAGQTFVRLWDTATWRETKTYDWQSGPVTAVALAPEGTTAAAGCKTGAIVLWDLDY